MQDKNHSINTGNKSRENVERFIYLGTTLTNQYSINLWTPNINYSWRTAPLTSKIAFYIFIQQIQVPNILNMVYTLRFFLFKMQFVS